MADRLTFAELLRQHRRSTGLTQDELAERARLSTRAISDLERGVKHTPQRATLQLLIAALALSSEDTARLTALAHRQPTGPPLPAASSAEQPQQLAGSAVDTEAPTRPRPLAGYLAPFPPQTRYATSDDISVAYRVLGSGPFDLVTIISAVSHLEYAWECPAFARYYQRLAEFSRLILFDKRGTGMSDRVSGAATLEQRMDDVRAIMDAAGSQRAVLFGGSEGGPMAMLFAATYPERTAGLILYGTFARNNWAPDYPWRPRQQTPEEFRQKAQDVREGWGRREYSDAILRQFAPSAVHDERLAQWWATWLRLGASPGAHLALMQMNWDIDVRHVLPAIRVPTLILHRTGDLVASIQNARYMAERIPGAQLVEVPGDDHVPFVGDADRLLDEIERFMASLQPRAEPDRVLATVLAIEGGALPANLNSAASGPPSSPFQRHSGQLRHELDLFRGQEIRLGADSALAAFDGPARAIRCGQAISSALRQAGVPVQVGLHTGECEVGTAGLRGAALHIAEQVARKADIGQVLVSSTVKDLVAGSGFQFQAHGHCTVEGFDGAWRLYQVG